MYGIKRSSKFKKDLKTAIKRGYNMSLLDMVVTLLVSGAELPEKYKNHALSGNWAGYMECHITPDWLLIYKIKEDVLILSLTRTGTHSDIFE